MSVGASPVPELSLVDLRARIEAAVAAGDESETRDLAEAAAWILADESAAEALAAGGPEGGPAGASRCSGTATSSSLESHASHGPNSIQVSVHCQLEPASQCVSRL